MAILAGIGRALTSFGTDREKTLREAEARGAREAEIAEGRVFQRELIAEQEESRRLALEEERKYQTRTTAGDRLYATGVAKRALEASQEQARLLNEQRVSAAAALEQGAVNRAAIAAGVAADVRREAADLADERHDAAVVGMQDIMNRGNITDMGRERLVAPPLIRRPFEPGVDTHIPDARSWADVQRPNYNLPTTASTTVPTALWQGFQDQLTPGGFDPLTGRPIGPRGDMTQAYNMAQNLMGSGGGAQSWRTAPVAEPPIDGQPDMSQSTSRQVAPVGMDPDEYRRMLESGATPADIQDWMNARQAGRGGR